MAGFLTFLALIVAAVFLFKSLNKQIKRVDFWRNLYRREQLRKRVVVFLDNHELVTDLDQQGAVADQIVQTARYNHVRVVERCA